MAKLTVTRWNSKKFEWEPVSSETVELPSGSYQQKSTAARAYVAEKEFKLAKREGHFRVLIHEGTRYFAIKDIHRED